MFTVVTILSIIIWFFTQMRCLPPTPAVEIEAIEYPSGPVLRQTQWCGLLSMSRMSEAYRNIWSTWRSGKTCIHIWNKPVATLFSAPCIMIVKSFRANGKYGFWSGLISKPHWLLELISYAPATPLTLCRQVIASYKTYRQCHWSSSPWQLSSP